MFPDELRAPEEVLYLFLSLWASYFRICLFYFVLILCLSLFVLSFFYFAWPWPSMLISCFLILIPLAHSHLTFPSSACWFPCLPLLFLPLFFFLVYYRFFSP
jgi:hypothetical protein